MKLYFTLLLVALFTSNLIIAQNTDKTKPNILLICVDDLRNNLGVYGDEQAITPNIDALAKQGVTFRNHQVQYAVCGPSRAVITTGLMPEETGVIGFKPIRAKLPNVIFLPEYFKNNGYTTAAAGKIHDPRTVGDPDNKSKDGDDPASWTIPYLAPRGGHRAKGMSMDASDLPDEDYVDGIIRVEGIKLLEQVAKKDEPFFMAIGFKKPHEPFIAPKKYWDLYDNTTFKVAENQNAPIGRDDLKTYVIKGKDVKQNMNAETGLINEDFQLKLKKGYYACTSFVDVQIGLVIDKLEQLGVADNTIIVLWGDHGLFLGEHGRWNKHSNLEVASSSPLIIIDPRNPKAKGETFSAVSTIDIYPTLCELAGLEIPEQPKNATKPDGRPIKGRSLVPILNDTDAQVKIGAITVYRGQRGLGYGYRVKGKYRYIEWVSKKGGDNFYELYDYERDPNETRNLAVTEREIYEPLLHKFSRNIRSLGEGDGCLALLKTKPYDVSPKNKKNILVRDADNDGIPDDKEGKGDTDNDGIPDYLDSDSDNNKNNSDIKKTKVFFLAGQSNMDGRAKASGLSKIDKQRLKKAQKNVTLYYNFDEGKPLDTTKVAKHIAKKFGADYLFGPELFFGIELSEKYPDHKIVLIKRSRGGMSLYGAWNPDWTLEKATLIKEEKQPKLYAEFIEYSTKVLSTFEKDSYDLCGILWVQGESDSGKKGGIKPREAYEANLTKLINRARTDFNHPKLPFLIFQVGNGKVVEGIKNVAKLDNNVILIPQEKNKKSLFFFEQNPPPIWHYTAKSMKKIGIYFFEYYEKEFASKAKN